MINFLGDAFNLVAGWMVDVAEQPWLLPTLALGIVVGGFTYALKEH